MADTPTPGQRLDTKLAEARTAFDELRPELEARAAELGEDLTAKIDAAFATLDELQTAWDNRSV